MAEERNVLIFEIKKVGVDAANKALKEYVKLSKEADAVKNKSSDGGKTPFTKAASEAGQYGSALEKLNSIQKTSMSIEEKLAGVKASYISKIHEYNAAIKKGVGVAESQLIQSQKHNEHLKGQVARIDNVRSAEILLQNTFKAGLQVFQEHSDAITLMNQRIDSLNPGVKRLTEVWHAKTANELLGAKATREADMAIGMLEKTLKGTTDALKRQEIQEKIAILTQKKATAGVLQNVQAQKLWRDQEASKTRIITQANDVLKKYNLTLRTMDKELKVAKDGVAKLTVMFRQENSIIDGASSVLATYDKRLIKVRTAISKSTDALKTEALALREKALVEARGNTVLAKRTALMKLANIQQKQSKFLLKDASIAILTYNDKIKTLVKRIQDEYNVVKKVTAANKALREARILGASLATHYADALDKVEKELKQNLTAERRLALEMKRDAIVQANRIAMTAKENGLNQIRRKKIEALSKAFSSASQSMIRFGRAMSRYVTTTMVAALAQGVRFAANIEAQTVRFGVLTGSLEKGSRLFQEIIAFSAKTPFLLPQLDEAAQVLLAFGSPLRDVMNELRMLGDVAQGDAQKLERIATSFGKVRARGTAHMRELNRFIMSGVPIISELNKQLGLTGNELFTMIQKNLISFANINKAFKSMTSEGGKFYKMTETVAKTLQGRFSTSVDNMNLNLARLMEDFTPWLKGILEQFIDWSQAFRTLDSDARKTIVTVMAVAASIGPLSIALGGLLKMMSLTLWGTPFGLILAGIAAVAGVVAWVVLKDKMQGINDTAEKLKDNTESLTNAQVFQRDMIPGLSLQMYDLAKSYDAYALAVGQANAVVANRETIEAIKEAGSYGNVLNTMSSEFSSIMGMSQDPNNKVFSAGATIRPNWVKNDLKDIIDILPQTQPLIAEAIKNALGEEKDISKLTRKNLRAINWYKLGNDIGDLVGRDVATFNASVIKVIEAENESITSGKSMEDALGHGPVDLLKDWGVATGEGLAEITGDLKNGLIDFSASILRTNAMIAKLPGLQQDMIAELDSGELTLEMVKKIFPTATDIDKFAELSVTKTEEAMVSYGNLIRDLLNMRIFEIQDESQTDNLITSILGITDEKDIKKQLQTQLDAYVEQIKQFGLTTEDLIAIESGKGIEDKLTQELVTTVINASREAKAELETLLKAQDKISLFDAFFQGDENSFQKAYIQEQINSLTQTLAKGLSNISGKNMPAVGQAIDKVIADGMEGYNSDNFRNKFEGVFSLFAETGTTKEEIAANIAGINDVGKAIENFAEVTGTDIFDIIHALNAYYETLGELGAKAEENPLQSIFEAYFGAGTKLDATKTIEDMMAQADLATAITTALEQVATKDTNTTKQMLWDALLGTGTATLVELGVSQKIAGQLEDGFTDAIDKVDSSGNEALFRRLVGDPKDLEADLQKMLAELKFEEAFAKILKANKDVSSMDVVKTILGDPARWRDEPAYKEAVEAFALIPKDIEDAIDTGQHGSIFKAFLTNGTEDLTAMLRDIKFDKALENAINASDTLDAESILMSLMGGKDLKDVLPIDIATALQLAFDNVRALEIDPFTIWNDSLKELGKTIQNQFLPLMTSLGEAMASGEWGTDGFASSISDLAKTIWDSAGALMFQAGVSLIPTDPALGATLIVGSGVMSLLSGLVSGASGETPITGGASTIGLAKGGIVNSPQLAMIGEGGEPEAVVPLSRASSMGFGGGNVNIVVNNTAKADVETRESTGADGSRQIEFMIYDTMKKGMNSGELDSSMGSNFGISRQGRR